jgi:hypothetical protein
MDVALAVGVAGLAVAGISLWATIFYGELTRSLLRKLTGG